MLKYIGRRDSKFYSMREDSWCCFLFVKSLRKLHADFLKPIFRNSYKQLGLIQLGYENKYNCYSVLQEQHSWNFCIFEIKRVSYNVYEIRHVLNVELITSWYIRIIVDDIVIDSGHKY